MAIVKEDRMIRGVPFIYTVSDKGMFIEKSGELYEDALDPKATYEEYTETNIPIHPEPDPEPETQI